MRVPGFTKPVPAGRLEIPVPAGRLEITDLLIDRDPSTGSRLPVRRSELVARFEKHNQRTAARICRGLPANEDVLDESATDGLMLRIHCELQRLGEELQLPRLVAEQLAPWVSQLQREEQTPVRILDIGCGLGHVLRWLAWHETLGPAVELVGVDLNSALVSGAVALSRAERLKVEFLVGDALTSRTAPDPPRTIVISTGLLHHLGSEDLPEFFASHRRLGIAAFAHWDIEPSGWTTVGAWMFHRGRMREAVSRHDGVMSARRAHPASVLLDAAAKGAGDYRVFCGSTSRAVRRTARRSALVPPARPLENSRRSTHQRPRRGRGWQRGQRKLDRFMKGSRQIGVPQRRHG